MDLPVLDDLGISISFYIIGFFSMVFIDFILHYYLSMNEQLYCPNDMSKWMMQLLSLMWEHGSHHSLSLSSALLQTITKFLYRKKQDLNKISWLFFQFVFYPKVSCFVCREFPGSFLSRVLSGSTHHKDSNKRRKP